MPPKPFYEVQPSAYIFIGNSVDKPEEKVRQWALYELLSTYGVGINNITIEKSVKVGTRTFRADIVILRDGSPYVVIECKKEGAKKKARGMDQALSYADANTVKAKYVVYTNGEEWEVKRKLGGDWVDIPDLPKRIDGDYKIRIDELVGCIDELKPALFWINQTVPAASAQTYFSCLQRIFYGAIYPLNYLDDELRFGTDLLLRVISRLGADDDHYVQSKMVAACGTYANFFKRKFGQAREYDLREDSLRQLTVDFQLRFQHLVEKTQDLKSEEVILVRFITTLLHYLKKQIDLGEKKNLFKDIPSVLTRESQELIAFLFQVHLGVIFPDPVLEDSCTDLRHFCSSAWEMFEKDNKQGSQRGR